MCEVTSEVEVEGELRVIQNHELKVLQMQARDAGKKESAESGGDCCEPLCSPITCGP